MTSLPITITVHFSERWPRIFYGARWLSLVVWRGDLTVPTRMPHWRGRMFGECRRLRCYYLRVGAWEWLRTNMDISLAAAD